MDHLGKDYEKLLSRNIRKSFGRFYTPEYIIDYMLDLTLKNADVVKNPCIKVLDPSCGTGFFLIKAYEMLREKFENNIDKLNKLYGEKVYHVFSENSKKDIKGRGYWVKSRIHYHILKNCIFGADIDGEALKIAGRTLMGTGQYKSEYLNLIQCDSLIKWENCSFQEYMDLTGDSSRSGWQNLKKFWQGEFDYIIGNPPYVVLLKSAMDRNYFEYLEKNYTTLGYKKNAFYILIERSIEKLKNNGIHSFVVPDRYFSSRSYVLSRKMLVTNTKIMNVTCFFGKVFQDAVVGTGCYAVEKGKSENGHSFDLNLNFTPGASFDNDRILQQKVLENKDYIFNILALRDYKALLQKITKAGDTLGDYCHIHVGMMIKDKNHHFHEAGESEKARKIVLGRDMKEYRITNMHRYFIPEEVEIFGGTKDRRKHEKHPKLFLRKTGDKITAAPDFEGIYAEQSVYIAIPKDVSMVYSLLGQLQSSLCNFVYMNKLVSNPGKYPYIQHYDALKLPVNASLLQDCKFEELIKKMILLMENSGTDYEEAVKLLQEKIDKAVYNAYGLDPSEIELIENYTKK